MSLSCGKRRLLETCRDGLLRSVGFVECSVRECRSIMTSPFRTPLWGERFGCAADAARHLESCKHSNSLASAIFPALCFVDPARILPGSCVPDSFAVLATTVLKGKLSARKVIHVIHCVVSAFDPNSAKVRCTCNVCQLVSSMFDVHDSVDPCNVVVPHAKEARQTMIAAVSAWLHCVSSDDVRFGVVQRLMTANALGDQQQQVLDAVSDIVASVPHRSNGVVSFVSGVVVSLLVTEQFTARIWDAIVDLLPSFLRDALRTHTLQLVEGLEDNLRRSCSVLLGKSVSPADAVAFLIAARNLKYKHCRKGLEASEQYAMGLQAIVASINANPSSIDLKELELLAYEACTIPSERLTEVFFHLQLRSIGAVAFLAEPGRAGIDPGPKLACLLSLCVALGARECSLAQVEDTLVCLWRQLGCTSLKSPSAMTGDMETMSIEDGRLPPICSGELSALICVFVTLLQLKRGKVLSAFVRSMYDIDVPLSHKICCDFADAFLSRSGKCIVSVPDVCITLNYVSSHIAVLPPALLDAYAHTFLILLENDVFKCTPNSGIPFQVVCAFVDAISARMATLPGCLMLLDYAFSAAAADTHDAALVDATMRSSVRHCQRLLAETSVQAMVHESERRDVLMLQVYVLLRCVLQSVDSVTGAVLGAHPQTPGISQEVKNTLRELPLRLLCLPSSNPGSEPFRVLLRKQVRSLAYAVVPDAVSLLHYDPGQYTTQMDGTAADAACSVLSYNARVKDLSYSCVVDALHKLRPIQNGGSSYPRSRSAEFQRCVAYDPRIAVVGFVNAFIDAGILVPPSGCDTDFAALRVYEELCQMPALLFRDLESDAEFTSYLLSTAGQDVLFMFTIVLEHFLGTLPSIVGGAGAAGVTFVQAVCMKACQVLISWTSEVHSSITSQTELPRSLHILLSALDRLFVEHPGVLYAIHSHGYEQSCVALYVHHIPAMHMCISRLQDWLLAIRGDDGGTESSQSLHASRIELVEDQLERLVFLTELCNRLLLHYRQPVGYEITTVLIEVLEDVVNSALSHEALSASAIGNLCASLQASSPLATAFGLCDRELEMVKQLRVSLVNQVPIELASTSSEDITVPWIEHWKKLLALLDDIAESMQKHSYQQP